MANNYIDELNASQREAVMYNDGPMLVIAGAGSGKTRVLTYKIAYLLENGYQPWNVLALTFTNKAAREMKERIARQVGAKHARYLWMGTFHSIFLRILHAEASALNFSSHFTIYDTSDSKSLLRSIIKEMGLDEKQYKVGVVLSRISNAKNHLVTPASYAANAQAYSGDIQMKMPAIRDIYQRYYHRCHQADTMDFDDLLLYTYLLFSQHPDVLQRYQQQFRYILVDEYQDTNFAQHSIVRLLAQQHSHVCVVGDDAQSIYSFRGADIDNILSFTKIFQGAKLFKLEQNYRSTQTIVSAANSLIAKNHRQIHKDVFSEKEKGEPIPVFQAYSDIEECEIVANKISELRRREGDDYNSFAILYRTNAQSRVFEETLRKHHIPYRIYGGLSFYQRKEIKDIISYFRLVVNPNDEEALKRIINYPARGIGATTLNKITDCAASHQVSLWEVLSSPLEFGLSFNKGTIGKLQAFRSLILACREQAEQNSAAEAGKYIIHQSHILNDISQDNTTEALSRKENVEELLNGLNDFCVQRQEEGNENINLSDFLSEVSLLTDQDSDEEETNGEKVTLMTVHSAKGLEFPTVFVVGLENDLFPSGMAGDSPRALEEERRLFYVAITRAEKHCYLSYAKSRMRYGKMEFGSPSIFLKDIDLCYLHLSGSLGAVHQVDEAARSFRTTQHSEPHFYKPRVLRPVSSAVPSSSTPSVQPAVHSGAVQSLQPGQKIEHERFGVGEVISVEGTGDNAKATIHFKNAGNKQLLLRFARFRVL